LAGNFARGADGEVIGGPAAVGTLAVVVAGGAAAEFAAPVSRVASVTVNAGGTARVAAGLQAGDRTLVTGAVSVVGDGRVDVGVDRLVVDYSGNSPLAAVMGLIKSGFNAGGPRWQGGGIVSGAAATDVTMGIGYAEASDVLHLSGNQTGAFGGATVDASSVLVRFTRLGDANLDGRVGVADFQRLELGYGMAGQGWGRGDFNYDGIVDDADFRLLYANFDQEMPPAALESVEAWGATVPEPGIWGLGAMVGGMLASGRRRSPLRSNSDGVI
jgi:hypothetical protein